MTRTHPFNGAFLVLVGIVIVASIALAYNSLGPPNLIGHSSDEIRFDYETNTNDCTASLASDTCQVSCPPDDAFFKYHVVSGGCISANALRWRQSGCTGAGAACDNAWICQDMSHVPGKEYIAYVNCLKGGHE